MAYHSLSYSIFDNRTIFLIVLTQYVLFSMSITPELTRLYTFNIPN